MSYYLFIDTSIQEYIQSGLFEGIKLIVRKSEKVGVHYSEKILSVVDGVLDKIKLNELAGIFVVYGPGRFSALRTGVSVANALAWALGVPAVGVPAVEDSKDYWARVGELIGVGIKNLNSEGRFEYFVVPKYGQEPNIAVKKK